MLIKHFAQAGLCLLFMLVSTGCAENPPSAAKLGKVQQGEAVRSVRKEPSDCQDLGLLKSYAKGSAAQRELQKLVSARGGDTMMVHKKSPGTIVLPMDTQATAIIAHAYSCGK